MIIEYAPCMPCIACFVIRMVVPYINVPVCEHEMDLLILIVCSICALLRAVGLVDRARLSTSILHFHILYLFCLVTQMDSYHFSSSLTMQCCMAPSKSDHKGYSMGVGDFLQSDGFLIEQPMTYYCVYNRQSQYSITVVFMIRFIRGV